MSMQQLGFRDFRFFEVLFVNSKVPQALTSREGDVILCNEAFANLLGYSMSEMMKLSYKDVTHPADLKGDEEQVKALLQKKISNYSMVKRYLTKQGLRPVWVDLHVQPVMDIKTGEVAAMFCEAIELPNHGKFKVETVEHEGKVVMRPTVKFSDLVQDNPRTAIAITLTFLPAILDSIAKVLIKLSDLLTETVPSL